MAEAIELLFAEKLSEESVDEEIESIRREALKDLRWIDLIDAETKPCPGNPEIQIPNPKSRVPIKAPRGLKFLNQFGKDIRQERTLEIAFWLDHCCGWPTKDAYPRYQRARDKLQICA